MASWTEYADYRDTVYQYLSELLNAVGGGIYTPQAQAYASYYQPVAQPNYGSYGGYYDFGTQGQEPIGQLVNYPNQQSAYTFDAQGFASGWTQPQVPSYNQQGPGPVSNSPSLGPTSFSNETFGEEPEFDPTPYLQQLYDIQGQNMSLEQQMLAGLLQRQQQLSGTAYGIQGAEREAAQRQYDALNAYVWGLRNLNEQRQGELWGIQNAARDTAGIAQAMSDLRNRQATDWRYQNAGLALPNEILQPVMTAEENEAQGFAAGYQWPSTRGTDLPLGSRYAIETPEQYWTRYSQQQEQGRQLQQQQGQLGLQATQHLLAYEEAIRSQDWAAAQQALNDYNQLQQYNQGLMQLRESQAQLAGNQAAAGLAVSPVSIGEIDPAYGGYYDPNQGVWINPQGMVNTGSSGWRMPGAPMDTEYDASWGGGAWWDPNHQAWIANDGSWYSPQFEQWGRWY